MENQKSTNIFFDVVLGGLPLGPLLLHLLAHGKHDLEPARKHRVTLGATLYFGVESVHALNELLAQNVIHDEFSH